MKFGFDWPSDFRALFGKMVDRQQPTDARARVNYKLTL